MQPGLGPRLPQILGGHETMSLSSGFSFAVMPSPSPSRRVSHGDRGQGQVPLGEWTPHPCSALSMFMSMFLFLCSQLLGSTCLEGTREHRFDLGARRAWHGSEDHLQVWHPWPHGAMVPFVAQEALCPEAARLPFALGPEPLQSPVGRGPLLGGPGEGFLMQGAVQPRCSGMACPVSGCGPAFKRAWLQMGVVEAADKVLVASLAPGLPLCCMLVEERGKP